MCVKKEYSRARNKKLIEQICRKVRKGKGLEIIAEELEEEVSTIAPIYEAVLQSAPDYDTGKMHALLHSSENETYSQVD